MIAAKREHTVKRGEPVVVIDTEGVVGILERESSAHNEAVVRLEDGTRVHLAADVLQRGQDGQYRLATRFEQIVRHGNGADDGGERHVIPVVEEHLDVNKRVVETARLRVHINVNEQEEIIDEPLLREEIEVERVTIDQYVDAPQGVRQQGETTIIPLYEEVLVVQKRLRLKEELHLTRKRTTEHEPQRVVLRREQADVNFQDAQPDHKGEPAP
ncbi:MAG: YsnF/AvaK domain-containing protein [Bradymonadaceae bacterium]|nr:YsnF/AvaK domain-containing protein [Lujinxingiaceae bacterium]